MCASGKERHQMACGFIQGLQEQRLNVCISQETLANDMLHQTNTICTYVDYEHLTTNFFQWHAILVKVFMHKACCVHISWVTLALVWAYLPRNVGLGLHVSAMRHHQIKWSNNQGLDTSAVTYAHRLSDIVYGLQTSDRWYRPI